MGSEVSAFTLVTPGAGEVVGDAPDRRVEILSDHETLHATWSRFGPHRAGADLHVHRHHTDLFFVLQGELVVALGPEGAPVDVRAGTLVRVPPLVVHGFRNGSDAEVRYLNLHAPGRGFADFMRALNEGRRVSFDQYPPPSDGGRSPREAMIGGGALVADDPGLRVALLADVEQIGVAETWSDPGAVSPPLHRHHHHVESVYVLEGEVSFTVGDREFRAEAGSWVQVPPGVPHTFASVGENPAHFLDLHTPNAGFGTFVRAMHEARNEQELQAARAAFDQEAI